MNKATQVPIPVLAKTLGTPANLFALIFGIFLGLCVWKFGNPVILDHVIGVPRTPSEFFHEVWPAHWAGWILLPLAAAGAWLAIQNRPAWGSSRWLWLLPLVWLGWQFIAATQTEDTDLTAATLWQFSGCVACYFLGALVIGAPQASGAPAWRHSLLLLGLLAAFTFCLVRAVEQRLFEFPANYQMLVEGEHNGWTNFPPATLADLKSGKIIINTNGVDVANPVILDKFAHGRVSGTLVYPNALAEIILLLWPLALVLTWGAKKLRPGVRLAAMAMALFLGGAAFFWTGSKLGWLIAIALAGIVLLRLNWSQYLKLAAVAAVLVVGLGVFTIRFHHYFATGATSAGARIDYWRAAAQTTAARPVVGSGPGTFQRPYARLKSPQSEMARLVHNDYLEQFSDSGIIGGLAYSAWIFLALAAIAKKFSLGGGSSKSAFPKPAILESECRTRVGPEAGAPGTRCDTSFADHFSFAVFLGLVGWFAQGFGEFGLYVPALAWTAFTLLGCLIAAK